MLTETNALLRKTGHEFLRLMLLKLSTDSCPACHRAFETHQSPKFNKAKSCQKIFQLSLTGINLEVGANALAEQIKESCFSSCFQFSPSPEIYVITDHESNLSLKASVGLVRETFEPQFFFEVGMSDK